MFQYDRRKTPVEPPGQRQAAGGFGFVDFPTAVWKRKFWPLALSVILAAIAAVYAGMLEDRYQSTAQLLIDPRELRILNTDVAPSGLNSDSTTAYLESQVRIITSTDMLRRISGRELLAKDTEYTGKPGILERLFPITKSGDQSIRIIEKLSRNLSVRRGERTFIVDVAVTATVPEKAARLANAFAGAYLEDQANSRSEQVGRTSAALTSRLNDLRERVRVSGDKVEAYKSQKNIVSASGKLVTDEQLIAAATQLAAARSRTADVKARLDQIESVRAPVTERGALPEAINSQTIGLLRQQLGEAQRRISNLSSALGPIHPDLVSAQTQFREAQRAVADEIGRIRQAARADFERSQNSERAAQAQVDALKQETLTSGRDNVELRELERDLESNRAVYQAFLQRARETSEQQGLDTTNARIITTAVPSIDRVGPPRRLMVMGAAAAGFLLGLLIAFSAEFSERMKTRRKYTETMPVSSNARVEPLPVAQPAALQPAVASASPVVTDTATEDLMRMLRMLGRLEKAIGQHGIPR